MASNAAKAKRRAEALDELKRLSALLAEHLEIEAPQMHINNHLDPELGQIQRIENVNTLLRAVLSKVGVSVETAVLETMTKAELLQKAAESGVDVSKSANKTQIIEKLEGK
jgi:hypothetical protein